MDNFDYGQALEANLHKLIEYIVNKIKSWIGQNRDPGHHPSRAEFDAIFTSDEFKEHKQTIINELLTKFPVAGIDITNDITLRMEQFKELYKVHYLHRKPLGAEFPIEGLFEGQVVEGRINAFFKSEEQVGGEDCIDLVLWRTNNEIYANQEEYLCRLHRQAQIIRNGNYNYTVKKQELAYFNNVQYDVLDEVVDPFECPRCN